MTARVDFDLYLITDRKLLPPGRLLWAVEAALEAGVRAVQLREKDLSAAELLPLARRMRELTARFGAHLLINDRVDVALAVEADGVHLGGHSLPAQEVRRRLGPNRLIGLSTHNPSEAAAAASLGADFVTFGPVFFTASKAALGKPVGLDRLAEAAEKTSVPLFALGGIKQEHLPQILAAGASRIALISAVLCAKDPAQAVRQFFQQSIHHR